MKFNDLDEELTDSDVHLTVDNEGFAELTEVYNKLDSSEHEFTPGIPNESALKDQLLLLTKMHEQLDIPGDVELSEISKSIMDIVEKTKTVLDEQEVVPVSELVENSGYLKEKRDYARTYVNNVTGKLHPNTKNHIDNYLKKHTGNCSDNFVTVTRIGRAPITPEQKKNNDEAALQALRADAVYQIVKISKFLLEQAEGGKINFASPQPVVITPPTVKEKVLNKLDSLKSKFNKTKRELFYSALNRVQKILNVE
jgi:hypothetical protein